MMTQTLRPVLLLPALLVWLAPTLAQAAGGGDSHFDLAFTLSLFANFILFVVLMFFLLRRPISGFFAGRAEEVERLVNQAKVARDKAEQSLRDFEAKIAELNATRDDMLAKARVDAAAEQDRILASARAQAERLLAEAERAVAADYERARGELAAQAARLVADEAEKLLRASLREEDADRLADEYIDMLREVKS